MRINKKVTFSILMIGMLACVASAGTWAYFQNTITSTGNGIQTATLVTQYSTDDGVTWYDVPDDESFTIQNVAITGIVPTSSQTLLPAQKLWIRCLDSDTDVKAIVHIKIEPVVSDPETGVNVIPGLQMYVGARKIYDGTTFGGFYNEYTTEGFDDGSPIPVGDIDPRKYDVSYRFLDKGNQNQYEGKDVTFDMVVTVTAVED